VQWQIPVNIGGALTRKRTSPHRHPPSIGSVQSAISFLCTLGQQMWIGFAIDIASVQSAYDAAMDNMTI
jgi:hypothetical protein